LKTAVLFDADGTILDSEEWLNESFRRTAKELGFFDSVKDKLEGLLTGKPLRERYIDLAPDEDVEECIRVHMRHQADIMDLIEPFEGVAYTLALLSSEDVVLAVVTSRRTRAPLIEVLRKYDLERFFSAVICLEDVENPKPHPEGILLAMRMLGVNDNDNVFMVGDAVVDIEAGKNAGVKTVGALYGFEGDRLTETEADYLINSFPEVLDIIL